MRNHSPKYLLAIIAVIVGMIGTDLVASPQASGQATANQSLRALESQRGRQVVTTVVGVAGFFGQDQPLQWRLLAVDPKVPNLLHEYAIQDGKIVKERHFSRRPEEDLPSFPIPLGNLRIDSTQAFAIVNANASKAGIGFDSVHYQLRCRDLRNEPVWVLNLIDQDENSVGVQYVSAITGQTLRSVWHRPGTQQYSDVNNEGGLFTKIGKSIEGAGRSISKKATPQGQKRGGPMPVPNYAPQPQRTARQPHKVVPLPPRR